VGCYQRRPRVLLQAYIPNFLTHLFMFRILLTVQYKGSQYCGWQFQPGGLSIQEVLSEAVSKILSYPVNIVASGRTDAGVHALCQVCHFDVPSEKIPKSIKANLSKLVLGLNTSLPDDIVVSHCKFVKDDFHSQLSAKRKRYVYHILNSYVPSPFYEDYTWRVPYKLNIERMKKAATYLKGQHDFASFCASDSTAKTTVRKVYSLSISCVILRRSRRILMIPHDTSVRFSTSEAKNLKNDSEILRGVYPERSRRAQNDKYAKQISISITGNGFLKHMVRNIVGTLVDVGRGRLKPTDVKRILQSHDRRKAGMTAPAKGLFLERVTY
jgi:tRNA pseudouridine38-40 synthase